MNNPKRLYKTLLPLLIICSVYSCSKSGGDSTPAPSPNPCSGITINVSATLSHVTTVNGSNGSIAASATGGNGFTFSLNNGSFQSSGTFGNLSAGTYTITARNSNGCSGSASFTITAPDACAGKTINISATTTNSDPCSGSGSITVTASGSTGFMYTLNNGTFQASNVFNNVATGSYTIGVRDADGCLRTSSFTVGAITAGTRFSEVKQLIQANCVSCHGGTSPQSGLDFSKDCVIVQQKDRIKARAVDGNPSFMPTGGQLSAADKNRITAWINAGGRYSD
jgi:hypothetical protein